MTTTPAQILELQNCIQTFLDQLNTPAIAGALTLLDIADTAVLYETKKTATQILGVASKNWVYWTPGSAEFPMNLHSASKIEVELDGNSERIIARAGNLNWGDISKFAPGHNIFRYREL